MTSESNQNTSGFFYVYILQSTNNADKFYTGFTENLQKRLKDHNSGKNPHTVKYKPWHIKTAVAFSDRDREADFERYLKSSSGRAFSKKHL
jgi:putative endonuclease